MIRPSLRKTILAAIPVMRRCRSPEVLPFEILRETPRWLAINKPAGVNSTANESLDEPDCVSHHLARCYSQMCRQFRSPREFGAVHRLDRNTTGVLLVAKDKPTLKRLCTQFRGDQRSALKSYSALVLGVPQPMQGDINLKIAYRPGSAGRHVTTELQARQNGMPERFIREARTRYQVVETFAAASERYSLVDIELVTGRTHQIRFHFQCIGHALLGERYYTSQLEAARLDLFPGGQALHAREVQFTEPWSGEPVHLQAPWPENFRNALELFRRSYATSG